MFYYRKDHLHGRLHGVGTSVPICIVHEKDVTGCWAYTQGQKPHRCLRRAFVFRTRCQACRPPSPLKRPHLRAFARLSILCRLPVLRRRLPAHAGLLQAKCADGRGGRTEDGRCRRMIEYGNDSKRKTKGISVRSALAERCARTQRFQERRREQTLYPARR